MASTQTNIASTPMPPTGTMPASTPGTAAAAGSLLVSLVPLAPEALETMLANLSLAFAGETVLVATPDAAPQLSSDSPLRLLPYTVTTVSTTPWILTAADYLNTYKLAQENRATACVLLGAESQSLHPEAIRALAQVRAPNRPHHGALQPRPARRPRQLRRFSTPSPAPSSARAPASRSPSTSVSPSAWPSV